MFTLNQPKVFGLVRRIRALLVLVSSALAILLSLPAAAQPMAGVEYESRVFLPRASDPLNVDEAVIRWILKEKENGYTDWTVSEADLEFLQLKIDDTDPNDGGVFIDDIITPDEFGVPQVEPSYGRADEDAVWEFRFFNPADFEEDEGYTPDEFDPETDPYDALVANYGPGEIQMFQNFGPVVGEVLPELESGETFFKVVVRPKSYEVVPYSASIALERRWVLARDAALAAGGHLATITSADENDAVHYEIQNEGLAGGQAWIGGFQPFDACEPGCFWTWVNDEGPIPLSGEPGFSAWLSGEPNNTTNNNEDHLTINLGGNPVWNDSIELSNNPAQYVIEYDPVYVAEFFAPLYDEETEIFLDDVGYDLIFDEIFELELLQRTATVSTVTVRDIPTPVGKGTIFDIPTIEQEGLVVKAGLTNVDVCVAPDPREGFMIQGQGRQFKGKGKGIGLGADEREVTRVFNRKPLAVSDLAGAGTCTGELPNVEPGDEYQTWEDLLGVIDLTYPADYRGYVGQVDLTPEITDDLDVEAVWFMVVVVRSTAEFAGPVSVVNFPEELINYDQTPVEERPVDSRDIDGFVTSAACENTLAWRPIDLAGNVLALDGTVDVEGSLIPKTVQCNRSWSLTRRSTHVVPGRLDALVNSGTTQEEIEITNVLSQLEGLRNSLLEAGSVCTGFTPGLYPTLQFYLDQAELAFASGLYIDEIDEEGAVNWLETFAELALFEGPSGENEGEGFDLCPIEDNVPGNLVSRSLTAAFTIHDRFVYNGIDDDYLKYQPEILTELTPDLRD